MAEHKPVVAIMGPEPLLVQEAVAAIRNRTLTTASDFNRDEIDLSEHGAEALLAAARTLPVMATQRFVHGFHLHRLAAREHEALLAYLQQPEPHAVVVLSGERPDGRLKLIAALRRTGALQVLEAPKPHALPHWLMARARTQHIVLAPAAAQAMVAQLGERIGPLAQALELLCIYAGTGGSIEVQDVAAALPHAREASIFTLCDALGPGHWGKAACALDQLLRDGEEPLAILAMVTRQLRLLLGARTFVGRAQELPSALGAPPFVANKVAQAARRLAADDWADFVRLAQQMDFALRYERRAAGAQLKAFVLTICCPSTQPTAQR